MPLGTVTTPTATMGGDNTRPLPVSVRKASCGADEGVFFVFLTEGEGCMAKVNTFFSYYRDLCAHSCGGGMSAQSSLIGRLQGPQREMTEQVGRRPGPSPQRRSP